MITAKEAQELSGPSASDYLKFIDSKIRDAASKKAREVVIRDDPYARWLYSKPSGEAQKAIETLQDNGFDVDMYYKEHSIAVDMGLRIKW